MVELPAGAPPSAGPCDFCGKVSAHLERLDFLGLCCEDCAHDLRPDLETWQQWNDLVREQSS